MKHRIIPFLAALLLSWFLPALAFAACSGPAGNAGDTIYNSPYHVLQYCDGATWHAMGPTGAGGSGCAPSSGLVGWWKFDETSGTSAADSSGNGNTGTLQAAASWTAGKINGALYFNGTTQFVTASDSASLDLAGSWTASAWVNLGALPTSGNEAALVGKPTSASGGGPNYAIDVDNTGGVISWEVFFEDTVNGYHTIDYNATINLNTWYQVTGVWDNSAKNLYLYVNGVQVGSTLNIPGVSPATAGGDSLYIGNFFDSVGTFTQGTIDDARVYNQALSATQVSQLYTGGLEGDLMYNSAYHVLQFCNGTSWVAMGPMGGAGGACTSPAGNEADIIYNSASAVMQYCSGKWVAMGY